jgi:hypothetical protein
MQAGDGLYAALLDAAGVGLLESLFDEFSCYDPNKITVFFCGFIQKFKCNRLLQM